MLTECLWLQGKLMDSGFGKLKLLRISCRIDDDLVSIEVDLVGVIEEIEEFVQSVDLIDVSAAHGLPPPRAALSLSLSLTHPRTHR